MGPSLIGRGSEYGEQKVIGGLSMSDKKLEGRDQPCRNRLR